MPQIIVEYSARLEETFDRRAATLIDSTLGSFKTRFHRLDEVVIGAGAATDVMVHADLAILPGRSPETKRRLGQTALDLLVCHLGEAPGLTTQATVEVRELQGAGYHRRVLG
ncbi:5-carboxymethyl-2-hydroxymuconate Delta-isomerase [Spirillospora sp. NPDC048911]|uniref:5-carboxymethyl-2-hydroxymuconate Delta-isomerase n=1 Tax=Spirillospora sp. NPDC048911 TaxID=3364527 RepID=UPI00371A12BB